MRYNGYIAVVVFLSLACLPLGIIAGIYGLIKGKI